MIVWLYYEKIRRICTYCAGYFHNAEQCPSRSERILTTGDDQGFGLHGAWMTQWSRIPMVLVDNQLTRFQGLSSPPSQALSTLRQVFGGTQRQDMARPGSQDARSVRNTVTRAMEGNSA